MLLLRPRRQEFGIFAFITHTVPWQKVFFFVLLGILFAVLGLLFNSLCLALDDLGIIDSDFLSAFAYRVLFLLAFVLTILFLVL